MVKRKRMRRESGNLLMDTLDEISSGLDESRRGLTAKQSEAGNPFSLSGAQSDIEADLKNSIKELKEKV